MARQPPPRCSRGLRGCAPWRTTIWRAFLLGGRGGRRHRLLRPPTRVEVGRWPGGINLDPSPICSAASSKNLDVQLAEREETPPLSGHMQSAVASAKKAGVNQRQESVSLLGLSLLNPEGSYPTATLLHSLPGLWRQRRRAAQFGAGEEARAFPDGRRAEEAPLQVGHTTTAFEPLYIARGDNAGFPKQGSSVWFFPSSPLDAVWHALSYQVGLERAWLVTARKGPISEAPPGSAATRAPHPGSRQPHHKAPPAAAA